MAGKLKGWKEVPEAGTIIEPGNARNYKTGGWRSSRPVWNKETCIHCFFCWIWCPDMAIQVDQANKKMTGIDFEYCKGCGVCAEVCPKKCFTMKNEKEFTAD